MALPLIYGEGKERRSCGGVSGPGGLVIINRVPWGLAVRVRAALPREGDVWWLVPFLRTPGWTVLNVQRPPAHLHLGISLAQETAQSHRVLSPPVCFAFRVSCLIYLVSQARDLGIIWWPPAPCLLHPNNHSSFQTTSLSVSSLGPYKSLEMQVEQDLYPLFF